MSDYEEVLFSIATTLIFFLSEGYISLAPRGAGSRISVGGVTFDLASPSSQPI